MRRLFFTAALLLCVCAHGMPLGLRIAMWNGKRPSPTPYTVRFAANGGMGSMVDLVCQSGASTQLPLCNYRRDGYDFVGWATNGTDVAFSDGAEVMDLTAVDDAVITLAAQWEKRVENALYVVIDVSDGPNATRYPVTFLDQVPEGGWTEEYKTQKIVLRRIPHGTFMMGSPEGENAQNGHYAEDYHEVTLSKDLYMGVFEFTQSQWTYVMGDNPSICTNALGPVDNVSYDDIRGANAGGGWPTSNAVDPESFLGRLRLRTGLANLDLPTEAQWEYVCRAGTTTDLNSGKNLDDAAYGDSLCEVGQMVNHEALYEYVYAQQDPSAAEAAAYEAWEAAGHNDVGSYLPNSWGIYDMHGSVWEWCLDWWKWHLGTASVTDPVGAAGPPIVGQVRLIRGGSWSWGDDLTLCRSAWRYLYYYGIEKDLPESPISNAVGFRLCLTVEDNDVGVLAPLGVELNGYTGVYDGSGHGVSVAVTAPAEGAQVKYALFENGPFSAEKPVFTNVCEQTVWVEVSADNYATTTNSATVKIDPRPLAIVAKAMSKTYGEADPALTYTATGLVGDDTITGELEREAGEVVGQYAILQGTLTAGGNYAIAYTGATFTICKAPLLGGTEEPGNVIVTVGGLSKFDTMAVYDGQGHTIDTNVLVAAFAAAVGGEVIVQYAVGDAMEPDATTWASAPNLYTNAGEYVVWYRVSNPNYEDFAHATKVVVSPRPLIVAADVKSKIYGDADPALTYMTNGLVAGDTITGELEREAGEVVGQYAISQGTLSAGGNYEIAYTGATFTICKATLLGGTDEPGDGTVTGGGLSKFDTAAVYDGQGHTIDTNVLVAAFAAAVGGEVAAQYAVGDAIEPDATTWASVPHLYTNAGEYVVWYRVSNPNYEDFAHAAKVIVSPCPLIVAADHKTKNQGEADPKLTYAVTGLLPCDELHVELEREAGEAVGTYAITLKSAAVSDNYELTFVAAALTIQGVPPRTYKVIFHSNGGNGKMTEQTIEYDKATALMRNAYTHGSHVFIGWSENKGGAVVYNDGETVRNLAAPGASVTLYAVWADKNYKVAFNANGGTSSNGKKMAAESMTYGTSRKLSKNLFTRKGYVFIGWATKKGGSVKFKNAQSVKNLRTDGKTTTLYAVWAKKTYKVTFYANGGKGKMAVEKFTYGKAKKLTANKFKRKGYTFKGWAKSKTLAKKGTVAYKNKQAVKNLVTNGKTVKLYAVWKKK